MRQYAWLARRRPILLLLVSWGLSYAGDLAAFTAASVYAYHAGGAGLVGVLGLAKALPGAVLVPLVTAFVPRLSVIDGRISAPGPALALLRQVSFFRPLPFALVEHLASELRSAAYEPGEVLIREGEPGEHFYMIAEGRTRAARDGKQLREMSTGDSFGEIALLRRIPRTATVTAVSRVEAMILTRGEFLAAVTGSPESVESAEGVVSSRLKAGLLRIPTGT